MIKLTNNGLTRKDRAVSIVENQLTVVDSYCAQTLTAYYPVLVRAAEEVLEELEKMKNGNCV